MIEVDRSSSENTVEYTRLPAIPNLLAQYGKAALGSVPVVGGKRDGTSMPEKGVEVEGVRVDVANLAAYARVCGLRFGDALPLTYPFTLAFPLSMQLMLDPASRVANGMAAVIWVSLKPGATALTVIFLDASSAEAPSTNPITPALEAA